MRAWPTQPKRLSITIAGTIPSGTQWCNDNTPAGHALSVGMADHVLKNHCREAETYLAMAFFVY